LGGGEIGEELFGVELHVVSFGDVGFLRDEYSGQLMVDYLCTMALHPGAINRMTG
jgi:hypothetical protein